MTISGQEEARLALHGGRPVRDTLLTYGRQDVDEDDIRAVVDVLRSEWLTTGPKIDAFEQSFAARVGAKCAVSFSSGTAALHAAMHAIGIDVGDEVIVPCMTFVASANCVVYQGGVPVFVDVRNDTLLIDSAEVEAKITARTKAIIAVDYAGHPCDYDGLKSIAKRHNLFLVADACHALGATYHGHPVGSLADLSVFSFHPVKHITTGEGGMVTTDDAGLARRLRIFRNHGIDSSPLERQSQGFWYYEMVALGYNYRLTDIGCALGLSQLGRLEANIARRHEIAARYTETFRTFPGLIPPAVLDDVQPSWHLYPVRLNLTTFPANRAEVFRALRAENIGVNVHYIPVHWHPYYQRRFGRQHGAYPVAEQAYERLMSLPIFHRMTERDIEDVVNAVTKVVTYYG